MPHETELFCRLIERSCRPPRTNERTSFRRASGRTRFGVRFDQIYQEIVIVREPEKVAFLGNLIERAFVDQAVRHIRAFRSKILVLGLKLGTRCAEPALVKALVDRRVPFRRLVFRDLAPEMLDAFVMERLGRPHEHVIAAIFGVEPEIMEHPL